MTIQLSTAVRERGAGRGRPIDETDNRFGRWLVVGRAARRGGEPAALWRCRCDCGNESIVRGWMLRKGASQSCGCLHRERTSARASLPTGVAGLNRAIANIQSNARRRGYEWELSRVETEALVAGNCYYCGGTPNQRSRARNGDYRYNGIDRVDNATGYVSSNVVACCFTCNSAKASMSKAEFLQWVERVYLHSCGAKGS